MTYPFSFEIDYDCKTGTFSSTSDLPFYSTTLSKCNCHDFRDRNLPCKHIYRLAVELGIIEIIKRPSYDKKSVQAIKESASIDDQPDQIKRIEKAKEEKCKPFIDCRLCCKNRYFRGVWKEALRNHSQFMYMQGLLRSSLAL